jgi:hypothetical protein
MGYISQEDIEELSNSLSSEQSVAYIKYIIKKCEEIINYVSETVNTVTTIISAFIFY